MPRSLHRTHALDGFNDSGADEFVLFVGHERMQRRAEHSRANLFRKRQVLTDRVLRNERIVSVLRRVGDSATDMELFGNNLD